MPPAHLPERRQALRETPPGAPALAAERRRAALERCRAGFDRLLAGNPLHAAVSFVEALALDDVPEAHYGMGLCFLHSGQLAPARRALSEAIALDPSFAPAYAELGVVEHLGKRWVAATVAYGHALAIDPDDERTRFNLALALRDQGESLRARRHLERLGKSRRFGASSGVELALIRLRGGGPRAERSARRYLERALARDPSCVAAQYNLGVLLVEIGEPREGRAKLSAVARSEPPGSLYQSLALATLDRSS